MTRVISTGVQHPDLFGGESRIVKELEDDDMIIYKVEVRFTKTTYEHGEETLFVRADDEQDAIEIAEHAVESDEWGWADEMEVEGDVIEMLHEEGISEDIDILEG